jgi:ubiquinone/menaquinone biosynthesis C-methylase UbiE
LDNQSYYDEFANWYERERGRGYHGLIDDLELSLLEPYIHDGAHVLEVGCGTGLLLDRVQGRVARAAGVDLSAGMLEKARERGLEVFESDACTLPFEDESFDLVYSFKVLAHVEQIEQALAEALRVTKVGGHLVLEFYNPWSVRYAAKWLGGPGKISAQVRESAVYTRWDSPVELLRKLPTGYKFIDFAGVRVFTPAAFVHKLPLVSGVVRRLEWAGLRGGLRYFGGFLVLIAQRA